MTEVLAAKYAGGKVLNFASLILACVGSIASIVRGMKDNSRAASELLETVEAIEHPIREIQKKSDKLSRSEPLHQLLEAVQKIRDVVENTRGRA